MAKRAEENGIYDYLNSLNFNTSFYSERQHLITYVCFQSEAESALKKARLLKVQKKEEYEKARSSTSRTEEEQPTAGGRTLEKKRRVEEEALQKVLQKLHYK